MLSYSNSQEHKGFLKDLSPTKAIIEDIHSGKMVILVDSPERENEGDLVISAEHIKAEHINFMTKYARGLVCLALPENRVEQLGLKVLESTHRADNSTAFTTSIEARNGISTGISAADRATTIRVAMDEKSTPNSLATPGHIFPLRSQKGGVLSRAGHTEAAVDITRLARIRPGGVICEIMRPDGKMARMKDLIVFSKKHNIKIGSIENLIAYRLRWDSLIKKVRSISIETLYGGNFEAILYRSSIDQIEHLALVKGTIAPNQVTPVRVHTVNYLDDVLHVNTERASLLKKSMKLIQKEGKGVIILIKDHANKDLSQSFNLYEASMRTNMAQTQENHSVPKSRLTEYGIGAQILRDLGVHDIILYTNTHKNPVGLGGYGLKIKKQQTIS